MILLFFYMINMTEKNECYKPTLNVDIFACTNLREFMKMGNFACIIIHVLSKTGSLWYYKSNFQGKHIFADI